MRLRSSERTQNRFSLKIVPIEIHKKGVRFQLANADNSNSHIGIENKQSIDQIRQLKANSNRSKLILNKIIKIRVGPCYHEVQKHSQCPQVPSTRNLLSSILFRRYKRMRFDLRNLMSFRMQPRQIRQQRIPIFKNNYILVVNSSINYP